MSHDPFAPHYAVAPRRTENQEPSEDDKTPEPDPVPTPTSEPVPAPAPNTASLTEEEQLAATSTPAPKPVKKTAARKKSTPVRRPSTKKSDS